MIQVIEGVIPHVPVAVPVATPPDINPKGAGAGSNYPRNNALHLFTFDSSTPDEYMEIHRLPKLMLG